MFIQEILDLPQSYRFLLRQVAVCKVVMKGSHRNHEYHLFFVSISLFGVIPSSVIWEDQKIELLVDDQYTSCQVEKKMLRKYAEYKFIIFCQLAIELFIPTHQISEKFKILPHSKYVLQTLIIIIIINLYQPLFFNSHQHLSSTLWKNKKIGE